jgi:DNA-binding transcriptional LysR family regulator
MRLFAKIVEAGSFVQAAQRLQISNAAATRQLADLEAHLGTRLLHRSTRRISLTESGRAYLDRCLQILADIGEAESRARDAAADPAGLLRINAPVSFSVLHLAPLLPRFLAAHPRLAVDVTLSDRVVDLVEEGYDLAVRIGRELKTTLVARALAPARMVTCAAPAYLARRGVPRVPADLRDHNCLTYTYWSTREEWRFRGGGREHVVPVSGNFHANNGDLLRLAARDGLGIAVQPSFIVGEDLRAGTLVQVLADFPPPPLTVYAVYASRRHLPAKVRALVDFLAGAFGPEPAWDAWMHPPSADPDSRGK